MTTHRRSHLRAIHGHSYASAWQVRAAKMWLGLVVDSGGADLQGCWDGLQGREGRSRGCRPVGRRHGGGGGRNGIEELAACTVKGASNCA
eukprot:760255-Hanusia_phi.AAC.4